MPPKKQQQENSQPYVPFYVLPIFLTQSQTSQAQKILKNKPINIKKSIDQNKIIQILKQKGLAQHINGETISNQGRNFVCENIKTVIQDFLSEVTKPVDPKKDAGKKDSKKDSKKQQFVADSNKEPILELTFQKKCNDFFVYLDFPKTIEQLRKCIQNDMKIDAVVIIQNKIKKGSNLPNYDLLGRSFEQNQLMNTLNFTKIQQGKNQSGVSLQSNSLKQKKIMIQEIKRIKNENQLFSNLIIVSIPFQKDLSHPQNDEVNFINNFFGKLCEITREKENYQNWVKSSVKKIPMIESLKQTITKQVAVESQDKKGKKDGNKQVEYTTVEQVVETKYESLPENIKSSLQQYQSLQSIGKNTKHQQDQIGEVLKKCLTAIELQNGNSSENMLFEANPQQILQALNSKPLVKPTFIQSLKYNLRQVKSFNQDNLSYNLIHNSAQINQDLSLSELKHFDNQNKQGLQFEFIIKTFTDFLHVQQPKIKMDLYDRIYREKFTKNQVLSVIQRQLLKDPKIYQGDLKNENIKLLCLANINPPGRVLYLNNIFEPKAVPNFQSWFKTMKGKQADQKACQFFDYRFEDVGNLSIKKQISTPTDNVTIIDQNFIIGNLQSKVIQFSKLETTYGIRKIDNENNQFWLNNSKQNVNVNIFQKEHQFKKIVKISQSKQIQGSAQTQNAETFQEIIQTHKRAQLWIRTDNFIVSNTPYPSIIWLNTNKHSRHEQKRRQFGPKGQITSYLNDGTVKIFYLNGNISTFRNNKWERIINDDLITLDCQNRKLSSQILTEGDKIIKIRQDQTVFVQYVNGNKLAVFDDGTKILFKKKQNIYEIQTTHFALKEQIIVKIALPRSKDLNIIGHGSAFSYLGFRNILQRSYDGFLYQIWHNKFSTHLYNEKYEYQNKLYEDQIRLVHFSDGSLLKMQGQQHVIFVQGDYEHSEQKLKFKWDQIFTIQQNHEEGVYDINLEKGSIKTRDAESNQFKINVDEQNQIKIAVSFKINDEDQVSNEFGNGFHVPEQNFFLPAPSNSLPPRIFSFNKNTNQYFEYLSDQQIREMKLSSSLYHQEEIVFEGKIIKQYTKQKRRRSNFAGQNKITTFSQPPSSKDFELPSGLLPKQTRINLEVQNNQIEFRILEKIDWDKSFNTIHEIQQKIKTKKDLRSKQLNNFSISV